MQRPNCCPRATKTAARPIIYVDGSHLEAMGKDPWGENGIGRFMRVLAHNGYLPLVAPDLAPERLNRAAMLISIAPAQGLQPRRNRRRARIRRAGRFLPEHGRVAGRRAQPGVAGRAPTPHSTHARAALGHEPETTPLGRFWYPNEEQPHVRVLCRLARFQQSRRETWPKDDPTGRCHCRKRHRQRSGIHPRRYGLRLEQELRLVLAQRRLLASTLKNWLGRQEDTTITAPKPKG